MNAAELWAAAARAVTAEYGSLPAALKLEITAILTATAALKVKAAALVDAGALCEACQGLCCRFGKHHFSVVDLLGFLVAQRELFAPDFNNPVCPYHTGAGCMMEPALRPFTCTIFICEQVEARLDDTVRPELAAIEQELRSLGTKLEQLLGNRFENGLLITYERSLVSGSTLFRY